LKTPYWPNVVGVVLIVVVLVAIVEVLVPGVVSIKGSDGTTTGFTMAGGFISVNKNRVSILGEESN